jgi:hypothetical protein
MMSLGRRGRLEGRAGQGRAVRRVGMRQNCACKHSLEIGRRISREEACMPFPETGRELKNRNKG